MPWERARVDGHHGKKLHFHWVGAKMNVLVSQMWTRWTGDSEKRFCLERCDDYSRKILDAEPRSQGFDFKSSPEWPLEEVAHIGNMQMYIFRRGESLGNALGIPGQKKSIHPSVTTWRHQCHVTYFPPNLGPQVHRTGSPTILGPWHIHHFHH